MNKQIDIFGNEIPIGDLPKPISGRKYKTMQQLHGELFGKKCGDCAHCIVVRHNRKNFYKCELWYLSSSEATDIRLKNVACKKFKEQ
jgi:hypothetical protein